MRRILFLIPLLAILWACEEENGPSNTETDLVQKYNLQTLGEIPYPPDNPKNETRIYLGKLLFFDPIVGGEKDASCATCHHPDFAFADGRKLSAGVSGVGLGPDRVISNSAVTGKEIEDVPRNAPTVFNTAYNFDDNGVPSHKGIMFWDGRVNSLEEQSTKPPTSRVEMRGDAFPGTDEEAAIIALDSICLRLMAIPEYVSFFRQAFPQEAKDYDEGRRKSLIDDETYAKAVAAYERELNTKNSAYDRFVLGQKNALSDKQRQGLELFFGKAKCSNCHGGPMFSNFSFVVQGVEQIGPGKGMVPGDDLGRMEHTKDPLDKYAFRTPSLRNVELTAPYMHDGSLATLREVLDFYNLGANPRHPGVTDEMLHPDLRKPLGLTGDEVDAIIEFMKSLTDNGSMLDPELLTVPDEVPSGLIPVFGK